MSIFKGSFIPSVLCLVLVIQPQERFSRNYEQRLLENKAFHEVEVLKKCLKCYFIKKINENMAQSIYSNENLVHSKSIINSKHFKLPFNIVLWNIVDEIFKISSNVEKFIWKSPLKLMNQKQRLMKLESWQGDSAKKVVDLFFKYNS